MNAIDTEMYYWAHMLDECGFNRVDLNGRILAEGLMDSIKSLFGKSKKDDKVDVAGLEKLARTNAMAFATAIACLTDEDKEYIIKNHPESPIAKALPAYADVTKAVEKAGNINNV